MASFNSHTPPAHRRYAPGELPDVVRLRGRGGRREARFRRRVAEARRRLQFWSRELEQAELALAEERARLEGRMRTFGAGVIVVVLLLACVVRRLV